MAPQYRLVVVQGILKAKEYALFPDKELLIGRDRRASVQIVSRTISRKHAKISFRNGTYVIQDLESKSGLLVNNRKVSTTILRHSDVITIGRIKFKFMALPERAASLSAPPGPAAAAGIIAAAPAVVRAPMVIPPKPAPEPGEPPEPETEELELPSFTPEELARVGLTLGGIKMIVPMARGRRSVVYKGTQASRNRVVALKVLQKKAAADPDIVHWFIRGAQRASTLQHEDIASPLGGGRDGAVVFLHLPFMENGSAQERFRDAVEEGVPAVRRALESLIHIARALEYAQGQKVLHLGLRPSKILYNELRHAKLIGLGFDNTTGAPGAEATPEVEAYRAPEQKAAKGEISAATDIFSLGAIFHYMLTGQPPERDRHQRISSPKLVNPAVPDFICRIAEKMVDPSLEARYKSYGQLLHDLRWALRGEAWPRASA